MKRFFKQLILVLSLCWVGNAGAANWLFIVQDPSGNRHFIDTTTVMYLAPLNRVNFNLKVNESRQDSQGNISFLENWVVNCEDRIAAQVFSEGYDRLDLLGRGAPRQYMKNQKGYYIEAGTYWEKIAMTACRLAR